MTGSAYRTAFGHTFISVLMVGSEKLVWSVISPTQSSVEVRIIQAVYFYMRNANVNKYPYPLSYDDSLARRDLGWKPNYSLEAGFREHIAIMRGTKQSVPAV